MRKHVFGRQFKRDVHERTALFRGLASELVMHERIETTEEKAKAIRRTADKLVTKAKHQDQMHALSLLQPFLSNEAAKKMLSDIGPRFKDRHGGYTRIIRLGRRFNDNAQTVRMEWVELTSTLSQAPEKTPTAKISAALPATLATKTEKSDKKSTKVPATKKKAVKKTKAEGK